MARWRRRGVAEAELEAEAFFLSFLFVSSFWSFSFLKSKLNGTTNYSNAFKCSTHTQKHRKRGRERERETDTLSRSIA